MQIIFTINWQLKGIGAVDWVIDNIEYFENRFRANNVIKMLTPTP